ncbi:phosphatidylinositol transfer protein csr1 [Kickxella alabastrina]|uniref:Phosphatidylinositol transfer protein csr1 n=1 Tax=Kickxella alabastrina TaxID=61397 RepID=A0ACC1IFE9_9FUNG|nr:phosphatidylinositol transfer protein csr1 [Kickxella alabastrina]
MANPVIEQYTTGKPIVDGTFGHLTSEQTAKLQQLWRKLFETFHKPASDLSSAPLPAEATEASKKEVSRSSSVPASGRSSRILKRHTGAKDSPSASPSPASSGWFGWATSSAKAEAPEYRQLVGDEASEASLPPPFVPGQGATTVGEAFWEAALYDHPDVLLLRFLRARKWQVDDALAMFLSCLKWRIDEQVNWLVWRGEAELNLALMRRGMGVVHKTDRLGQPVLHIPVRLNIPSAQPGEQMVEYTLYLMEVARIVLHPPAEKVCLLFDTTDMSLANMDWTFFRTFLHYLEHYYPECLGLVLIYNASWVFNGLWKLIRPLLDPVVAGKVHFVASAKDLQQFIAPESLPKEFGGADAFKYTYPMPVDGENKAMFDSTGREKAVLDRRAKCEQFEAATRRWAGVDSASDLSKDALGDERKAAADELVAASKTLDKYVRARTLYHRNGVIGEDLRADWNKV